MDLTSLLSAIGELLQTGAGLALVGVLLGAFVARCLKG